MLSAARTLLIVENDHDIDWEVDQEIAGVAHPHRERLRPAWRAQQRRRGGSPPSPAQICLTPVPQRDDHRVAPASMRAFAKPPAAETRRTANFSGWAH